MRRIFDQDLATEKHVDGSLRGRSPSKNKATLVWCSALGENEHEGDFGAKLPLYEEQSHWAINHMS